MTGFTVYLINAFLLTFVLVRPLVRAARPLGLVDLPQGRKTHAAATPVVGGIAIFVALAATWLQFPPPLDANDAAVLPGVAAMVLLGVVDDRTGMAALPKLVCQIGAVALMVLPGGLLIEDLSGVFGGAPLPLGPLAAPLTIVFVVAVVNAFNLIDGIDGAAGGVSVAALGWLAFAAHAGGRSDLAVVALILVFCVLGFLVYNIRHPWRARADVFLGDAGSMMLGSMIALLVVMLARTPTPEGSGSGMPLPLAALLWTLALPCIDMASLIVRRAAAGGSPFVPDRRHIHHMLLDCGLSVGATSYLLIGASLVLGAFGVIGGLTGLAPAMLLVLLAVPAGCHTAFVTRAVWRPRLSRLRRAGRTLASRQAPAPVSGERP